MEQNIQKKFNEAQNEIRLAIMDFIIDQKRPFNLETDGFAALKNVRLSGAAEFAAIADELQAKDGMVVDGEQNVNFIYPVSALPTGHRVRLADGRSFTAMCAIDAIGATFTFHQDTEIDSACAVCGTPVQIVMRDGVPVEHSPADLHALTFTLGEISNWAGSC